MHPTLTNRKLEEKNEQIWKQYTEACKIRNKKCEEWDTLDKNYQKELAKHETDLANLKIQRCQEDRVQAIASFATIDDAYEFRNKLIKLDQNHIRLSEENSRESAGSNGVMLRRWLFWDLEFPQMLPHQNYISNSRVWHYQPNPMELRRRATVG
ncbi:hypothetical protein CAEBREN_09614 [Caenorhabditis brenneri]|uniref:Uncharacterized protein n=1 Tax=Caenorhabditis brenneri TaxID=135651 RepID=G0NV19_CAEBE|nr:hypothetical protein CAEBREN_09614 [Caenorhabditis brenneri]